MFHHNSISSLVIEVNSKQYLDQPLMDLKELVLGKINDLFSLGRMVSSGIKEGCLYSRLMT